MAERNILVDGKSVGYEGLMDVKKLGATINHWINEHGYVPVESSNLEQVFEGGKEISVDLSPFKKFGDYVKSEISISVSLRDLKEVEVEMNGVKRKLWKGKAKFSFTAILITDYEHRWNEKPAHFFFRTLIDKFILKSHVSHAEKQCIADTESLIDEIRSFLNMYRFIEPETPHEAKAA